MQLFSQLGLLFNIGMLLLVLSFSSEGGIAWQPMGQPNTSTSRDMAPCNPKLLWVAGADNLITNGGFENGMDDSWQFQCTAGKPFILNTNQSNAPIISGNASILLEAGGISYSRAILWQEVTIPSDATSAVLTWQVWHDTFSNSGLRELRIEIRDHNNQLLAAPFVKNTGNWLAQSNERLFADLSAFVGQTVKVCFVVIVSNSAKLELDDIRLVVAPMPGVTFDVYLSPFATNAPTYIGTTSNLFWSMPSQKAFSCSWRVVTVRNNEQISSPVWYFLVGNVNTNDHYEISTGSTVHVANEPIEVNITARDKYNNFPSDAPLPGTSLDFVTMGNNILPPKIVISEFMINGTWRNTNTIELANVSADSVDISGWQLAFYNSSGSSRYIFTFPQYTVVKSGDLIFVQTSAVRDSVSYPYFYTTLSPVWNTYSMIGVALLDTSTNIIDFFNSTFWNVATLTVKEPIGMENWLGGISDLPFSAYYGSFQRVGQSDRQSTNDWVFATNSLGVWNPGMKRQFSAGTGKIPTSIEKITNLIQGVWNCKVTIPSGYSNVFFAVRDSRGRVSQSGLFDVKSLPQAILQIPSILQEGQISPTNAGTITLSHTCDNDVTISLTAKPSEKLVFPETVRIPAGASNASFSVQAPDDSILTGPITATLYGQLDGFEVVAATTVILDNSSNALTIKMPISIQEGTTNLASLELSSPFSNPLVVKVYSSDSTVLQAPHTLTVTAGQTNVFFPIAAIEDKIITGSQNIKLTAEVSGWPSATAETEVIDNESKSISLFLPTSITEGETLTNAATLTLSGLANTDLVVNLTSDDPSLVIPTSITVMAGQSNALFSLNVMDDDLQNGTRSMRITASATNFSDGVASIQVIDNDPGYFSVTVTSDAKFAGIGFPVTITAFDINGQQIPAFAGHVSLSAKADSLTLDPTPLSTETFVNSQWSGLVTLNQTNMAVQLVVTGPQGAQGQSAPFCLLPSPVKHVLPLAVADIVWNPMSQRLLASIAETDLNYSNSIITINPQSGLVENVLPVGQIMRTNPVDSCAEGRLALSSDGRTLYLGTSGATVIQQYDLTSNSLVRQFSLGTNNNGNSKMASDIQVLPGDSQSIAVVQTEEYSKGSTVLYRSGSPLPDKGPQSSLVMLSPEGKHGYSTLQDVLFSFDLSTNGFTNVCQIPLKPIWCGGDSQLDNGLIYYSFGGVFDPVAQVWLGRYPVVGQVNSYPNEGRFTFGFNEQWISFISGNGTEGQLFDTFSRETFQLKRSVTLSSIPGTVFRLQQCGTNWIAIHNGDSIYFLQSSLFMPVGDFADLSLGYKALSEDATVGKPFTYVVSVTNQGPATATGVVLDDRWPQNVNLTSSNLSQGYWGTSGRAVLGTLQPNTTATVTFTVVPTQGGFFSNDIVVYANEWDPIQTNSQVLPITWTQLDLKHDDSDLIPISIQSCAYDSTRKQLYASVKNDGSLLANEIAVIDALTGKILKSLKLGNTPNQLAVSQDGHYLYASINDGQAVQRFDLQKQQKDISFELGKNADNQMISVSALYIIPNSPESVAVRRSISQSDSGSLGPDIAIYDGVTSRPQTGTNLGYLDSCYLGFSADGTAIMGFNEINGNAECFSVTPDGIIMTNRVINMITGTMGLGTYNGSFFTSDGHVINFQTQSISTVSNVNVSWQGVIVHPTAGRICYSRFGGFVDIYDTTTLAFVGTLQISGLNDFIKNMVPMCNDRLAIQANDDLLYIARSSLLLSPDFDTDGDGIPDLWEISHGLNPDMNDANSDIDQDGASNFTEYCAGTNPNNPNDSPRLSLIKEPLRINLHIHGVSGHRYQLEQCSSLLLEKWTPIGTNSDGHDTDLAFPIDMQTNTVMFYRMKITK